MKLKLSDMRKGCQYVLTGMLMVFVLFFVTSCYHRHSTKGQHAALVEYSDRQRDSISFLLRIIIPIATISWWQQIL